MKMPNSQTINATISGTVILSNDITITNVYYILSFIVSLIYVSQLTCFSICYLNFFVDKSLILQSLSQKRIGIAKRLGDLYVFYALPTSCTILPPFASHILSSLDSNSTLWHHRLGHLSDYVYKCIATQFPFIPYNKIGPCDICHFSNKKCLPFPVSTNTSYVIFELIHADIWGPYSTPSIDGHRYF